MRGMIQCDKVYVDDCGEKGFGAYAACDIAEGEVVERGIARRLPPSFDGNKSIYVFTWSEDRTVWAIGSGCATFYNTSKDANTELHRNFDDDTFVIIALRPIRKDDELTHVYKSLAWRECFAELRE